MAWSWSHTAEAYAHVYLNVQDLPRETLLTILREWAYQDRKDRGRRPGFRLPPGIRRLPADILADLVWERMEAFATCTNGGWAAYCCPNGCHTVSFSRTTVEVDQ